MPFELRVLRKQFIQYLSRGVGDVRSGIEADSSRGGRKEGQRERGIKNGMLGNYNLVKLERRVCICVHKCE